MILTFPHKINIGDHEMAVDYAVIGRRIKLKRKRLGKTQDDVAEALSVSVGYISQIERGATKISLDTLSEIANFLGCDLGEFVTGVTVAQRLYLSQELSDLLDGTSPEQRKMFLEIALVIKKREKPDKF